MIINGHIDIIGDTHEGVRQIYNWINSGNVNNLIHVGDSILGWKGYENEIVKLGNALNQAGKNGYFIRGNHQNPEPFDGRIYGGQHGGIQFVKDGTISNWGSETILFVGGGISLDREYRSVGLDYWEDEPFKIPQQLLKDRVRVDHLVTHVSLSEVNGHFITDPFPLSFCANDAELMTDLMREQHDVKKLLDYLIDSCGNKIKSWHYGHYHKSISSQYRGIQCRGLAIDEIRPFNRKEY